MKVAHRLGGPLVIALGGKTPSIAVDAYGAPTATLIGDLSDAKVLSHSEVRSTPK